ncbi:hypothetical protein EJB05_34145, partial [Eragrostis curvula]
MSGSATARPSAALVGDTLYFRGLVKYTLKYQLATRRLSVIQEPPPSVFRGQSIYPMTMEEGALRFTGVEEGPKSSACLCLCSMEEGQDGVAQWARLRAIELEMLLPDVIEADSTREGPSSLDKLKMLMQRLLNRRIFRRFCECVGTYPLPKITQNLVMGCWMDNFFSVVRYY